MTWCDTIVNGRHHILLMLFSGSHRFSDSFLFFFVAFLSCSFVCSLVCLFPICIPILLTKGLVSYRNTLLWFIVGCWFQGHPPINACSQWSCSSMRDHGRSCQEYWKWSGGCSELNSQSTRVVVEHRLLERCVVVLEERGSAGNSRQVGGRGWDDNRHNDMHRNWLLLPADKADKGGADVGEGQLEGGP